MSLKKEYSAYSRVSDDEDSSGSFLPSTDPGPVARSQYFREYVSLGYLWLLHGILVTTYLLIVIKYLQAPKVEPLSGFFTPTDAPVVYEQKSIRTVFINNTFVDSYAGAGAAVDNKWDDLLGVGIIRLTEEEASRLRHEPAKLYGGKEGEYAGFLEMFHQLHCLNRLRKHFYDPSARLDGDEPSEFTAHHDEHCFDYIRQNLMCYSDVSVLPISWDPKHKAYTATFDTTVQKTCRNFEAIYAWAKTRQAEHIPPGNGGIDLHINNE